MLSNISFGYPDPDNKHVCAKVISLTLSFLISDFTIISTATGCFYKHYSVASALSTS